MRKFFIVFSFLILILSFANKAKATVFDQPVSDYNLVLSYFDASIETDFYLSGAGVFNFTKAQVAITPNTCVSASHPTLLVQRTDNWAFVVNTSAIETVNSITDKITFNFNFTTVNGVDYYFILNIPCDANGQNLTIKSTAQANSYISNYVAVRFYNGTQNCGGSSPCGVYKPTIYFNGAFPGVLAITAPPQQSLLSTATSTAFSGTCPTEGSNELMLTDSPFLARLATSTAFNILCGEGSWVSSFTAKPGNNLIWIITKNVIGENPPDINNISRYRSLEYTGDSGANSWALTLLTPMLGDDGWIYTYPDSDYIFKFIPTIPITASSTSMYFGLKEYTTNGRQTATTTDEWLMSSVLQNNSLTHHFNFSATSTQARYFRAYIKNASTTPTYLDFNVVISDSATAQKSVGDGNYDLGKWGNLLRGLFVPSMSEFQPLVQAMQTRLSNTIPFSYFWQAKAIMDVQSITTSTPTTINFIIPSSVSGEATTTSPMPILGSVVTDPVRSFAAQVRPYVVAGLWIYFCGFVLMRFKDFLST